MNPLPARVLSRALSLLLPCLAAAPANAQTLTLPLPGARYVDYSRNLDDPNLVIAVGKLNNWKEGKRERLANAKLGGAGAVAEVSGTQYFQVPVTATLVPRLVFQAKAARLLVAFDVQVARLPDGKERRQLVHDGSVDLSDDTLALFVLTQKPKQKGLSMLHVLPFDPNVDKGADGEMVFVDAMRDLDTINRRVHAFEQALAAYDRIAQDPVADDKGRADALATLQTLVDQKPELKLARNDGLLQQHAGPLEQRARKRLDDAAAAKKKAEKDAAESPPKNG